MFRLHAKRRGCGASASRARLSGPETSEGGGGTRRSSTSVAGNGWVKLAHAERPNTGWGAHRAAPRARRLTAPKRVAWRAPPHTVPIRRSPPTPGRAARGRAAARKHAVDMATSCARPRHRGGGSRSEGQTRSGSVPLNHDSATRQGAGQAATCPAPSSSSCMQHPGCGPRRVTRDAAERGSPRLAPSTAPSRATRRTAGDQARRVVRSPAPIRHTRVRDPPYRYKPHTGSRRERDPAGFLDRAVARAWAHLDRGAGPGDNTPFLVAGKATRPPRARRVP